MSEEPTRPEEVVEGGEAAEVSPQGGEAAEISPQGGEAAEVPSQADPPNEPAEPTNVQEPEMAAAPPEQADPIPEEKKPETEESEKKEPPVKDVQEEVQKEPSVTAKPIDAASEFPLADSSVLAELKAGEARAREAAKAIEVLKGELVASAKKDVMTDEDIKMMEQKQKELMEKMQEFEDITKKIQQLVGLVDVASSQLGLPQNPLIPTVENAKTGGTSQPAKGQPMDTLPKVIICGTSDIDEVPKIIVCEPTSARNGKQPLYQQIKHERAVTSKTKVSDTKGALEQDQTGKCAAPSTNPYMRQGYPCVPGGLAGPMRPTGDGCHIGMMPPGLGQAGMMYPGMGQVGMMCPGMGQAGMMYPGMGQPGMMQPGMGQPGMMQLGAGQAGMMQPGMVQQNMMMQAWMAQQGMPQYGAVNPGMAQPGGKAMPRFCKSCGHLKKEKSNRTKTTKGECDRSGVKTLGQNNDRPKNCGSETKKSCRKRKQCYCQISGLCQLNRPPFPAT